MLYAGRNLWGFSACVFLVMNIGWRRLQADCKVVVPGYTRPHPKVRTQASLVSVAICFACFWRLVDLKKSSIAICFYRMRFRAMMPIRFVRIANWPIDHPSIPLQLVWCVQFFISSRWTQADHDWDVHRNKHYDCIAFVFLSYAALLRITELVVSTHAHRGACASDLICSAQNAGLVQRLGV